MKINDAKNYFGTDAELARQCGFKRQSAIGNWRRAGKQMVPELYARRLHEKTGGELRFDPAAYGLHDQSRDG